MKRFLAVMLVALMLLSVMPASSMAASKYATVVGGWLRLRERPTTNSATITSYYTGTQVEILGSTSNWYHVRTPDGRTGYMSAAYLKVGGSGSSGSGTATVISYNGYGVRLRTGPSTGYRVIRTYPVGTQATVLQRGSNWSRISINGTVGYMMTKFLSFGSYDPSGSEQVVCYATIWSRNGYGVRLRTGPSTSYSKIGVYSVGTRVAVLQKGAVWDKIRVGSRVGWMMNEFLNYYGETELTSVSLNTMTPMVGDTMSAASIKPDKATVKYEWIRSDGTTSTVVGTGSTYTVVAADEGKTLQLRLKGTGSYTGTIYSAVTSAVAPNTFVKSVTLSNNAPVVGEKLTATVTPAAATVDYVWIINGKQVGINAAEYTVTLDDLGHKVQLVVTGKGQYSGTANTVTTSEVKASGKLQGVSIVNSRPGAAAPMVGDVLSLVLSPESATATYQWKAGDADISGATAATYTVDESVVGKTLTVTATGTANYTGSSVTSAATAAVEAKKTQYTVTVTGGLGGGNYVEGSTVTITANEPAEGQEFSQWKVTAGTVTLASATSATTTFTMPGEAVTVEAEYKASTPTPTKYSVTVNGTVQGSYEAGTAVTVNFTAPEGKTFKEWTISGAELTFTTGNKTTANIVFTMPAANVTLTPNYEGEAPVPVKYSVTVNGTVQDSYEAGTAVTVNFTAPEGKTFKEWTISGAELTFTTGDKSTPNITFTMPAANVSLTPTYQDDTPPAPTTYAVTVTGGTGSGDYAKGATVTITANAPAEGQEFSQWKVTAGTVTLASATSATTTFAMPAESVSVTAEYRAAAPDPVQLPAPGNVHVSDESTKTITWNGVDFATVYEYKFSDGTTGTAGGGDNRKASYEGHEGTTFSVRAVGDETNYLTSEWSTLTCPSAAPAPEAPTGGEDPSLDTPTVGE